MLNLLNDIFDTYINLYRISLLFVLIFQWFVLSYIDRIHFRTRTRKLGLFVSNIISYIMVKKYLYDSFRLYLIRPLCVILESVCGFMEGVENFETIIVISNTPSQQKPIITSPIICFDTKKDTTINHTKLQQSPSNINNISKHSDNDNTHDHTDSDNDHTDSENDNTHNHTDSENDTDNKSKHTDTDNTSKHTDDNKYNNVIEQTNQNKDIDIDFIDLDSLDEELDNDTIESHTPPIKAPKNSEPETNNTDSESSLQKAKRRRRMPIRLARRRYNNM